MERSVIVTIFGLRIVVGYTAHQKITACHVPLPQSKEMFWPRTGTALGIEGFEIRVKIDYFKQRL